MHENDFFLFSIFIMVVCSSLPVTAYRGDNIEVITRIKSSTGTVADFECDGNYIYFSAYDQGLNIFDVRESSNPVFCGYYDDMIAEESTGIGLSGDMIYLLERSHQNPQGILSSIDVSDPTQPHRVGNLIFPNENPYVLDVSGNTAVLLDFDSPFDRLITVDVSNPSRMRVLGRIDTLEIDHFDVAGDYAYLVNESGDFYIVDISHPSQLEIIGHFDGSGRFRKVQIKENFAYVADYDGKFVIFDVSNPHNPFPVSFVNVRGHLQGFALVNEYAYFTTNSWTEGPVRTHYILNVSNPYAPVVVNSEVRITRRMAIAQGDFVYTTSGAIWDMSDPLNPEIQSEIFFNHRFSGIYVHEKNAFLLSGYGINRVDISDIYNPIDLDSIFIDPMGAFTAEEGKIYVIETEYLDPPYHGIMKIIDASGTAPVRVSGECQVSNGKPHVLAVSGERMIVTNHYTIQILDISNPSNPGVIEEIGGFNNIWCVEWFGNYIYLGTDQFISILHLSENMEINEIDRIQMSSWIREIICNNDLMITSGYDGGNNRVVLFDVSDPANPRFLSRYIQDERIRVIYTEGSRLYLGGDFGIEVFDISNPRELTRIAWLATPGELTDIYVNEGLVYVTAYTNCSIYRLMSGFPRLSCVSDGLLFDGSNLEQIISQSFYIQNNGDHDLIIYDIHTSLDWITVNQYNNVRINPGERIEIEVAFDPYLYFHSENKNCNGRLTIFSNDLYSNELNLDVTIDNPPSPDRFFMFPAYPNPFNASTVLHYYLPVESNLTINVYNIQGQLVDVLLNGAMSAGMHSVKLYAGDMVSGLYFVKLEVVGQSVTQKLMLVK